jgi:hypothetical protein
MCEKKIQQKNVLKKNTTKKSKKAHFKIDVDFGCVLAKHSKEGHEKSQVMEHKIYTLTFLAQ